MYPVSEKYIEAIRAPVREDRITGGIRLKDGTKTWEDVPLPAFYVDGSGTTRKRNLVSLIAHDALSRLSVEKGAPPATSLYAALVYFCNRCNVGLAISESDFNALPNAGITPDFSAESVQTCWDGVMWIAQTVNCCAFADYRGLVQLRQYKYAGDGTYDRLITGQERTTIEYSDTRTYLAYLQSYEGDNVKLYSKVTTWTGTDAPHIREGALSLPKNPIVQSLTSEQQAAINQSYLENRSYPTRYIKASGVSDPAVEPFDVVAFSGGNIDVGQIINVATQVTWKFRNGGTIYCASVDEYSESADDTSTQSDTDTVAYSTEAVPDAQASTKEPIVRLRTKPQLEKRVDWLESQLTVMSAGAALTSYKYLTDLSAQCNGITYTAEKDTETGLISKISDGTGHVLTPEIPEGITDIAMHNAAVFALAMARGLGGSSTIMPIIEGLVGYFDYKRDCNAAQWTNQLGGNNIPITSGATINADCLQMPDGTYGMFPFPYTDGVLTAYAVLKCSEPTSGAGAWGINYLLGTGPMSELGNARFLGSFNGVWSCHSSGGTYDIISNVPSTDGYHVLCLVCGSNDHQSQSQVLYIDGQVIGNVYPPINPYGSIWGLNCICNGATVQERSHLTSYWRMMALGRTAHTAEQVARNTAWLKNYYGIGG